jgi:hypothetical protein
MCSPSVMRATESHTDVEKELRKTTRHPFGKQRQKDLYPPILSHQRLFLNKHTPPNRSENPKSVRRDSYRGQVLEEECCFHRLCQNANRSVL